MNKKPNKNITLEELVKRMDRGFKNGDEKIKQLADKMDRGFERVNKRFEQVDKRFEQVDERFNETNSNTDGKIESLARIVKSGFDDVYKELKNLNARANNLQIDMKEGFNKADDRFRETQEEINDLRKYVERIGKSSFEDSDILAEDVITLKRRVKFVEKRLQKLESKTPARALR